MLLALPLPEATTTAKMYLHLKHETPCLNIVQGANEKAATLLVPFLDFLNKEENLNKFLSR